MKTQSSLDGLGIALLAMTMLATIAFAFATGMRPPTPTDDTATQVSMTHANWLMACTSLAAAAISAVSLFFLRLTWLEAKEVRVETTRIGEAQTRAYLIATSAHLRANRAGPDPIFVTLHLTITNSGQTPADNVKISFKTRLKSQFGPLNLNEEYSDDAYLAPLAGGKDDVVEIEIPYERDDSDLEIIAMNEARYFISGIIQYRTVFGWSKPSHFSFRTQELTNGEWPQRFKMERVPQKRGTIEI